MNAPSATTNLLEELKIQAAILLKDLRSNDLQKFELAVMRFRTLKKFLKNNYIDIKKNAKRKDALFIIALENGFSSWLELKNHFYKILPLLFVDGYVGGFLNLWFARYADSKSRQKVEGGYLLPYKNQYFLAGKEYIQASGFDPNDSDWELIDWDWVKPKDKAALVRLFQKWLKQNRKRSC